MSISSCDWALCVWDNFFSKASRCTKAPHFASQGLQVLIMTALWFLECPGWRPTENNQERWTRTFCFTHRAEEGQTFSRQSISWQWRLAHTALLSRIGAPFQESAHLGLNHMQGGLQLQFCLPTGFHGYCPVQVDRLPGVSLWISLFCDRSAPLNAWCYSPI